MIVNKINRPTDGLERQQRLTSIEADIGFFPKGRLEKLERLLDVGKTERPTPPFLKTIKTVKIAILGQIKGEITEKKSHPEMSPLGGRS